ncbi:Glycosyl hydrolases family 2 [Paenibacillus catalpae]|uniref:Glycosyl hydrolases family 2 n=1 Tax=Paenibacillus catalpae TaxID=1045775 RepID=A0A1I1T2G5_9BACL|nr:glycoside hydrolase family 2 TIM barrel-domain containing protein [Paenibacillus catalpae]SFD52791.1 Glycosyl hydrolases family 2 [Paenibacillus catalpae]
MRTTYSLNGDWDFMPLFENESGFDLPADIVYEEQKVQVPSSWRSSYMRASGKSFGEIPEHGYSPYDLYGYPKEWSRADAGVLHRVFRVPAAMTEQESRIFLRFDGIMQKAAIYLDHHQIAVWQDGYLPLRVEVTERVKAGAAHHLHVVCGSFEKVTLSSGQSKITGLAGSWFGALARGIWQDVYLESKPVVSLSDVTIRTSVREGRLDVHAEISLPAMMAEKTGTFKIRLFVRESGLLSPVLSAEAPAGGWIQNRESSQIHFRLPWEDAKLWNPDHPFLYTLELVLMDGEQRLDRLEERFGFREISTDGPRFFLNGTPLNLRGDSWHFQGGIQQTKEYVRNWYRMCKEAGVNCIRLHAEPHPVYYLDIADEEGMLLVDETAIYGSSKSMMADHPEFIANCKDHIRRLVERDKNHPSLIMWSLQNEMRWVDGRDGYKQHIPSMMTLIRELDPTRPIILEGDNRLLARELTEVESRHYNIDGTIDGWDRKVPLVFGEHGGWWYICPQNSSMYVGHLAYRDTDECTKGLAEKERLFIEYARRQEVSGLSTFNFAHYFMRAMPERDIPLQRDERGTTEPRLKMIPRYSLTLNNGLLPKEYPSYRKNPSFDMLAAAFKPATIIPADYNRSFFDHEPIIRSFDVYNDTLYTHQTRLVCEVRQAGRLIHAETQEFVQRPAERITATLTWKPEPADEVSPLHFHAELLHDNVPVHELNLGFKLYPSRYLTEPIALKRPVVYTGGEQDYRIINALLPACERTSPGQIGQLTPEHLLVVGSKLEDPDGQLEGDLNRYVDHGGRVLLLEQLHLSFGQLAVSRQDFMRAHTGNYDHPVLQGLDNDDLRFWHEELREDGPLPIMQAAFEKPVKGNISMILECSAGDFGDGGDLWSPLLEYRSKNGLFIANQLELMDNFHRVPQACLLLRNLLAYAGSVETVAAVRTGVLAVPGGKAEAFFHSIGLAFDLLEDLLSLQLDEYGLIVAEPSLLADHSSVIALQRFAEKGGRLVILPSTVGHESALTTLVGLPVTIREQETYHLEADYSMPAVQGFSPVDLFGYDKVFLSLRDVVNRPLGTHSLSVDGAAALCTSVEGTAWYDYFIGQHTDEYSRMALVELNRDKVKPAECYVLQTQAGQGLCVFSQLLMETESDKSIRLYTRLLANLGAAFDDGLLSSRKGDNQWAVEKIMAMPCRPYVDYEAMKAYYIDPEFSLNNLGEGLYGWMQKKERSSKDGAFRIPNPNGERWFLSCFVYLLDPAYEEKHGKLLVTTNSSYEIYLNGAHVPDPEEKIILKAGINRLIAIVDDMEKDIRFGMVFRNSDGTYMRHLKYSLTLDEVEPK